jgi:hypothetical protein
MASRGARARTGASPRSNPSAAGAQRSLYLFGVTALAPVALLCAFAAREMLYSHPPVAPIPEGTHVAPPAPPIDPDPRKQPAEPVQPAPASGEPASPIAPKPSAGGGALKQRDEELPPEPAASGTELGQPGAPDPLLARYATIAEAISARDAGKISTQQMNRIVRPLRRREEDELRRVGSEYKAGNIALQALQAEQAAIRHQYEGPQ